MKYEFSKPYKFEGKEYKTIEIPLEEMTGADFAACKRSWAKEGNFSALPAMDSEFAARVAAKLAKQPVEFFEAMPAGDYCKITQAVSNFLLG